MKKQVLLYAGLFLVLLQACNSGEKPAEVKVVTDTITKTDTVTVVTEVDSAAIVAYYESLHKKSKGAPNKVSKVMGDKKVTIYSDSTYAPTDIIPTTKPAPATAPAAKTTAPTETTIRVIHDIQMYYFIPDEKATFPGGEEAFNKYLFENLQYPEKALEARESRTVYPTVFLDEQGHPVNVEFRYEPTNFGFQKEARRILLSSPRWNPARVGGKPVKSKFLIPITFNIAK
jgi:hypothetical protein